MAESIPWVEKYRPKILTEVVGNEEIIKRLNGSPGTGKTTSIICLAHILLGENFKNAVLELNASDERGIDVVRGDIKMFAQKKVTLPMGKHKIVILDEADSMTDGAQQALRRIMEEYSNTTRFALACNISDKIIEPIQSRCALLRYSKLTDEQILSRVLFVCESERLIRTNDGLEAILYTAQGDLRNALNNLQSTSKAFDIVNSENVYKLCDEPHPMTVRTIIELCSKNDIGAALSALSEIWSQGYSAIDIISTVSKVVKTMTLAEFLKLEYLKQIGLIHMKIIEGHTTLIQLSGLLAKLCLISVNKFE
ncbi:hypothetical protein MXB_5349, partial [Myxobolus squamalis]